jgi:hypothetical protein
VHGVIIRSKQMSEKEGRRPPATAARVLIHTNAIKLDRFHVSICLFSLYYYYYYYCPPKMGIWLLRMPVPILRSFPCASRLERPRTSKKAGGRGGLPVDVDRPHVCVRVKSGCVPLSEKKTPPKLPISTGKPSSSID